MKVINVVGARPNFMKVSPLHHAFLADSEVDSIVVHTGQHYDQKMSDVFFRQLELPTPDIYLGIGSGSHAQQTARVMSAFEEVVLEEKPDVVLVVGDVNSTLACTLVASKLHIPVAHVEAGLRSFDRTMPEEINRIVTDSISDLLFVTEESGMVNLKREGVPDEKVFLVGNVMIDSLVRFRKKAAESSILEDLGLRPQGFALATLHRPANVDEEEGIDAILRILQGLTEEVPTVFPLHPRTRQRFIDFGRFPALQQIQNLTLLEPLGYLEFLRLMEFAAVLVTDSGGIQEETTFLGVPCLTLRENTERPITVEIGTNELLPLQSDVVVSRARCIINSPRKPAMVPPFWDGNAAGRILSILKSKVIRRGLAA